MYLLHEELARARLRPPDDPSHGFGSELVRLVAAKRRQRRADAGRRARAALCC
jgi:hypothetical protein